MEEFDAYISSNGFLIIPEYDIAYLVDFNESNIPNMPEAAETTVRIAGKDGDIVLGTTYEPMSFEIVCYTDDNLTPQEKVLEESKINRFLNSIKKDTTKFALQQEAKFYDVKYNGNLTTTRYPAHLKFSIPLKASNPYGKVLEETVVTGSDTPQIVESETIEEVGAIVTILGPATNPELAINNYEMIYTHNILEGAKVIIDTGNSTITNINANNVKTNVMPYYNHQFPKIKPGNNEIKVQSGIDNPETQVKIEWYDLKL